MASADVIPTSLESCYDGLVKKNTDKKYKQWNEQKIKSTEEWATRSLLAVSDDFSEEEDEQKNDILNFDIDDAELFGWRRYGQNVKFR